MMAKSEIDELELQEESKAITKELLETAIRSKEGNSDINVKNFIVKPGSSKGKNYLSRAFAVEATTECNGKEKAHHLFVKAEHQNPFMKELTSKSKFFFKEGLAYSQIIPEMIRYQTERGIQPFGPSVPQFYYSLVDESNGIIILENIVPKGYILADQRKGLNYDACKIAMREIAVFHSLSFAMKDRNPANFEKYEYLFHGGLFHSSVPVFFKTSVAASVRLVKKVSDDSHIQESVEKLNLLDIDDTMKKLLEPIEPYALICHGDMWCNNMLFKYEEGAENPKPVDVKLLDLQVVRYALPTTDLAYFFYTSTTKATRDKHLNDLLGIYHRTFIDSLNKLNIEFQDFTLSTVKKIFKERAMFGILMACMVLPGVLIKPENVDEFTGSTDEELEQFAVEFYNKMAENPDNAQIIRSRLVGAIHDAVEMGLL